MTRSADKDLAGLNSSQFFKVFFPVVMLLIIGWNTDRHFVRAGASKLSAPVISEYILSDYQGLQICLCHAKRSGELIFNVSSPTCLIYYIILAWGLFLHVQLLPRCKMGQLYCQRGILQKLLLWHARVNVEKTLWHLNFYLEALIWGIFPFYCMRRLLRICL